MQYGTAGLTTPMHLSTEQFAMLNGIKLTHDPFYGLAPGVTETYTTGSSLDLTKSPTITNLVLYTDSGNIFLDSNFSIKGGDYYPYKA